MKKIFSSQLFIPLCISLFFFIAYSVMGVIRQIHFLSGYDLAIVDQAIWNYSHFQAPISTNQAYAFTPILWDHVELIFPLLVPFYWVYNNVITLILLQSFAICSSGIAVFLIAKKYGLKTIVSISLLISYLLFYGIQNAIWADVHSLVFGIAFLAWFIYFLEIKNKKGAWIFFLLTIICKEDMALLTGIISIILFVIRRDKNMLWFGGLSFLYLFSIFYIYFPYFVPGGYRFQSNTGLLSQIHIDNFYNSSDKRNVLLYSSIWFGFLPFLSPFYLLAALGDLIKYFVIGNAVVSSGQSIFGHYRSSLAILLIWPTIITIGKFKKFNSPVIALYLLLCAFLLQYFLHLPFSYFAKKWFWAPTPSVASMKKILPYVPRDAAVVTQINMLPHLSHRKLEFIMWPETKKFTAHSPCGQETCNWFHWAGNPKYMIVNTSTDWDTRYWLTNRSEFIDGIKNLQAAGIIKPIHIIDSTYMFEVLKHPL